MGTTWSPSLSSDRQTMYEAEVPSPRVLVTIVASPTGWSLYVSTCSFVKLASQSSYVCTCKYGNSLFIVKKAYADRVSYICSEKKN